jgi:Undecaprenyl-phosphate glucose phosphotransferase
LALGVARRALVDGLAIMRRAGLAPPRRFMVIGFEQRIKSIMAREDRGEAPTEILSAIALREHESFFADDLELAAAAVRMKRPDDVILALPWSRPELIEACLDTFMRTPTEIHLGTDSVLDRFIDDKLAYFGAFAALKVTRPALSRLERLEKRAFDVVTASLALIVLIPFFLLVALVIRLDSPGPALFRQKRYGFNQEPFRIFKFRTMTTLDDGRHIQQATRADPRVTRIGAFLRKYSIDELPQLLNVLTGEMSIVGPRPHALAHDQRYVRRLARYARRHNVKPGITGWAQVCGHRGEISSDEMMQARLEHDLYYVDNWSFWLDIKIIILTVVSPRAHANAY